MFGMTGIQEFVILILVIGVLSATGLWPKIAQGLRDIRGEGRGRNDLSGEEADLCYKILGLSPSSAWPEIEKAYRKKAKIHHPDLGGDEDAMRTLNEVYSLLKRTRRK